MADNAVLNAGTGGITLAADDVGGVHHQRVKVEFGADGAATDVAPGAPLPVQISDGTDTALVSLAGGLSVEVTAALPTGANAIGKLAANSGVDIGDVDVLSLPALPAGGNNIGDVDLIPGQVGITGGAGAVAANTPRTTLASDDPGVVALQLIDDSVHADDATRGKSLLIGAVLDDTAPTAVTENQAGYLRMSPARRLLVDPSGVTSPVSAASLPLPSGAATEASLASAVTALQIIDNWDETSRAKVNPIVGQAGVAGGAGAVGATVQRTTGVDTTIFRSLDLDETEEDVKTSAGRVHWVMAFNLSTGVRFLKFYNDTAANVVVGTTTPLLTIPIPTQAASANGAGLVISFPDPIVFSTAICVAAVTGVLDSSTGAPGANEVVVNIGYN